MMAPASASHAVLIYQWAVLLLVCLPLMIFAIGFAFPFTAVIWAFGLVACGKQHVAARDPVLKKVLEIQRVCKYPLLSIPISIGRVWIGVVFFFLHYIWTLFVLLARPKVVFVVYLPNYHLLGQFFCVGAAEIVHKIFSIRPENPWALLLGVIHIGPDLGLGIYGIMVPPLTHVTQSHLQKLPASLQRQFPAAKSIALAGRLPSLMAAAGVKVQAPLVDGLCGTVFAMTTAIKALENTLPAERKAHPTLAILGGGGYIGARLVTVLASQQFAAAGTDKASHNDTHKTHNYITCSQGPVVLDQTPHSSDDNLSDDTTTSNDQDIATATVMLRDEQASRFAYKQVIALDLRYEGNRHEEAGVLYTADPRDLSAADVVLVITRNGDNIAGYVDYAMPGQVWGDDTHPEIGYKLLRQLAAKGVEVYKVMAVRSPPTTFCPPLQGWPAHGTPGCLLMALVSAMTGRDWNGAGTGLADAESASRDPYWAFADATKQLGFEAMLTRHRKSKVSRDALEDI